MKSLLIFSILFLTGCGIATQLPSGSETPPVLPVPGGEELIQVSQVEYNFEGAKVNCQVNPLLVEEGADLSVFIEFNGEKIQELTQKGNGEFQFEAYLPPYNGRLRCVVEYAEAQFESSEKFILKDRIVHNGAAGFFFTDQGGVVSFGGNINGGDSTNATGVSGMAGILPDGDGDGVSDLLESGVKKLVGFHGDPEYGATNSIAALKEDGSVVAWGYKEHGGDPTGKASPSAAIKTLADTNNDYVADELSSGVIDLYYSIFAFCAHKNDGRLITWGDQTRGGDILGETSPGTNIKVLADANSNGQADLLEGGVKKVEGNVYSFAALRSNDSIVTWGDGQNGGDATGTTTATNHSLPDLNANGVADLLESGVSEIYPGRWSFAVLKNDGSVVSWGARDFGGDQTGASGGGNTTPLSDLNSNGIADLLESNVETIIPNYRAYAALKSDQSVVAWGHQSQGGDPTRINGGNYGYLPDANVNGVADLLESNVEKVFRTRGAFAALKQDGSLVVWGNADRGGDPTDLTGVGANVKTLADIDGNFIADILESDVQNVFSNRDAFVAIKSGGQAVVWGGISRGGDPVNQTAQANVGSLLDNNSNGRADILESGVVKIAASEHALAALTVDGAVVAWGQADRGGDPTCHTSPAGMHCLQDTNNDRIPDILASGVVDIVPMEYPGFIAIKENGQVISWGDRLYGGDIFNEGSSSSIGFLEDLNGNLIPDLIENP